MSNRRGQDRRDFSNIGVTPEDLDRLEKTVKEDVLDQLGDLEKELRNQDADVSEGVIEDVAEAIRDESYTDVRDDEIAYFPILTGFLRRFFFPLAQLAWRTLSALVLIGIFSFVGLFRLSNWLFTFRIFWLFFLISWVATAAFVANYEIIAETVRPGFQIIDDIVLRGFAPIFNDLYGIALEPLCEVYNFYYEFLTCFAMIFINAFELILKCIAVLPINFIDPDDTTPCSDSSVDEFFDDFIYGTVGIDLVSPNFRNTRVSSKTILRGMPVQIVNDPKIRTKYEEIFSRLTKILSTKDQDMQKELKKNFTRWSNGYSTWTRYDPQFLNAANIGFDFGWDPEGPLPQINGPGIGYTVYETTYEVIALITDIILTSIIFFLTSFKLAIQDTVFLFIVESFECIGEISPNVVDLIVSEIELALSGEDQPVPVDDIIDLFEQFYNDCLADFVSTWFDDIFLDFWKQIFDFYAELILQIPCIRFDSFGCFVGSLLECIIDPIGLIDFTVASCLGCAENDAVCIEDECRSGVNGILPIFDCILDTFIEIASEGICPVFEALFCYCILIAELYELLGEVLLEVESFCNDALDAPVLFFEFGRDFSVLGRDFGFDFDFSFDFNLDNPGSPVSTGDGNSDDDDNGSPSDDLFCYAFDSPFSSIDVSEVFFETSESCDIIFSPLDSLCGDVTNIDVQDCNDDHPFDAILNIVPDINKREQMKREGIFVSKENYSEDDMKNMFKDGSYTFDNKMEDEDGSEEEQLLDTYPILRKERIRQLRNKMKGPVTKEEYERLQLIEEEKNIKHCLKNEQCYSFNQEDDAEEKWYKKIKPSQRVASFYKSYVEGAVGENITMENISEEVARKIRKDKLLHLFLSTFSPSSHTKRYKEKTHEDEEDFQKRLEKRRIRYADRIEKGGKDTSFYEEQRSNPNSLYQRFKRIDRATNTYWDMASSYVDDYNNFRGNVSSILLHMVLMTTRVEWKKYPGFDMDKESGSIRSTPSGTSSILGLRFPTKSEMIHHFKHHKTHENIANAISSLTRFMRGFNSESTVNIDEFFRKMDPSYHKSDAPSVRHAHLYSTTEERKLLKSTIKQFQLENPEYREINGIRAIAARIESYMHISSAALFAPHMVDYAVNRLAMRGPEYDEPITSALRTFGMKRKIYNITQNIMYWTTEKDQKYMKELENMNGGKTLYTSEDYEREIQEAKKILNGEIDYRSERAWNNTLYNRPLISEDKAKKYSKMFPFLKHPKPSVVHTRTQHLQNALEIHERIGVFGVAQVLFSNPEVILSAAPIVVNTGIARHFAKIWSNYALLWFDIIFTDYVEITGPNILLSLRDLAEVILYNIIYTINYVLQNFAILYSIVGLILGNIIIEVVFIILRYVFPQVSIFLTLIEKAVTFVLSTYYPQLLFLWNVPPEPIVDSRGAPTQSPIKYFIDIYNCTNADDTCSTKDDCVGGAECRCDDEGFLEWRTFTWEIKSDTPCPGKTGRCICYPQLVCNVRFPVIPITNIIVPECEKFGYDFEGQVWYSSDGSFLERAWAVISASWDNFIANTKFIIRSVFAGWNVFVSSSIFIGILLIVGVTVLFVLRRLRWFFAILFFSIVLFYWTPVYTDWVASELIPFFQDLADGDFKKYLPDVWYFDDWIDWFLDLIYVDELFQELVDFITFPNATPSNPVGSPDIVGGEFTCFVIGFFSGVPGLLFFLLAVALGILAFSTGFIRLIVLLALFAALVLLQLLWALIWPVLRASRIRRRYEKISDFVVNTELSERLARLADRIEKSSRPSSMFRSVKKKLGNIIPKVKRSEEERNAIVSDLRNEIYDNRQQMRRMMRIFDRINQERTALANTRNRPDLIGNEEMERPTIYEVENPLNDTENTDTMERRRRLENIDYQPGDKLFDQVGDFLESIPNRMKTIFSKRERRPHNE